MAKGLKGSKTHDNLKTAFAGESQANRRYLYFARRADIEGYPDVGGLFRDTSEAETGHAFGHLDFLKEVGDPVTDVPIGSTELNLKYFRFSSVEPIGTSVTGSPTSFRKSRCPKAWPVSASDVSRKSPPTSG